MESDTTHLNTSSNSVKFHWKTAGGTAFLVALLGFLGIWVEVAYQNGQNVNTVNFHMDGLEIKYSLIENTRNKEASSSEKDKKSKNEVDEDSGCKQKLIDCNQNLIAKREELEECLRRNRINEEDDEEVDEEIPSKSCSSRRDRTEITEIVHLNNIFYDPESTIHLVVSKFNQSTLAGSIGICGEPANRFSDHPKDKQWEFVTEFSKYVVQVTPMDLYGNNGEGKVRVTVSRY